MRFYLKHHIKIAGRTTVRANVALLLIADARAIFHASRYAHVDHVFFHRAALAFALAARVGNYAPLAVARWTWPGNAEHGLLITDRPAAGASLACGWALRSRGSRAAALLTCFIAAYFDLGLLAESSFFKGKGDVRASISTALHTASASATATHIHAKEIAEEIAKNIADVGKVGSVKSAKAPAIHSRVAILVITSALLRVHEHAIGFSAFLEFFFRLRIARIAVRMPLHGQLAVRALDLLLGSRAAHAQYFVIIAFCLRRQNYSQPVSLSKIFIKTGSVVSRVYGPCLPTSVRWSNSSGSYPPERGLAI